MRLSIGRKYANAISEPLTNLDVAHGTVVICVGGDNNVHVLHDSVEGLVHVLHLQLKLQKSTVHLVYHENWSDTLGDSLVGEYMKYNIRSNGMLHSNTTLLRSIGAIIRQYRPGSFEIRIPTWRKTVSVWTQTPETQSTTTRAPSVTRRAAVTSDEKSTWPKKGVNVILSSMEKNCKERVTDTPRTHQFQNSPGESMRLIKKALPSFSCWIQSKSFCANS